MTNTVLSIKLFGQGIRDALNEYDLIAAVNPAETGINFVQGSDNFPAYKISSAAEVKSPYRLVLPEKLEEFAIMGAIKPETRTGGYVFSVVTSMENVVQLGVHISPPNVADRSNISLYYTSPTEAPSKVLASFEVPFQRKFTKIAFKVLYDKVIFYLNCIETETVQVTKAPQELVFDSASTLYIGQAGALIGGKIEVSI